MKFRGKGVGETLGSKQWGYEVLKTGIWLVRSRERPGRQRILRKGTEEVHKIKEDTGPDYVGPYRLSKNFYLTLSKWKPLQGFEQGSDIIRYKLIKRLQ